MNKKTITTIISATILALISAFIILHLSYKPQLLNSDKEKSQSQEVLNIQEKTIQKQEIPIKKQTTKKTNTDKTAKIQTNKIQQKPQCNIQSSNVTENKDSENTIQEAQVEITTEQNTEPGVEIHTNYTSKNTYKYVYTPAKFHKKKY